MTFIECSKFIVVDIIISCFESTPFLFLSLSTSLSLSCALSSSKTNIVFVSAFLLPDISSLNDHKLLQFSTSFILLHEN